MLLMDYNNVWSFHAQKLIRVLVQHVGTALVLHI